MPEGPLGAGSEGSRAGIFQNGHSGQASLACALSSRNNFHLYKNIYLILNKTHHFLHFPTLNVKMDTNFSSPIRNNSIDW